MDDNKLRWRCRRGMRELDMVLERFLASDFGQLDEAGRAAFSCLLDATDPELYDWLLGRAAPPNPALGALLERLKSHRAR
ncbi:MAG: succinate dehydrogenase assembly factor 2 [Gammaproteobacteria bacterium]